MSASTANVTVITKMDTAITLPTGVALASLASGDIGYVASTATYGIKVKHEDKPSKTLVFIENTAASEATVSLRGDGANERLSEDVSVKIPASSEICLQVNTGKHKRVRDEEDNEYVYITGTAATVKVRAVVLTY